MPDREAERRKRLSEALRENLKRRKNQSRGRAASPKAASEADGVPECPTIPDAALRCAEVERPASFPSKRRKV